MKLLIITLTLSSIIYGQALKHYKLEGKVHSFIEKDKVYYSLECKSECKAYTQFQKFKNAKLPKEKTQYAKSNASKACTLMNGLAVFGVDEKKNMMAFCRFSDDSLIEYRSLEQHFAKD